MKKFPTFFLLSFLFLPYVFMMSAQAQEMVPLNYDPGDHAFESAIEEDTLYSENGEVAGISNVTQASLAVYLPDPEIATGTGVIVLPGGGLRFLSWENEGTRVAKWLNSKGIAAFILKYRLYNPSMEQVSKDPENNSPRIQYTVDQFDQLINANTNPSDNPQMDRVLEMATDDAWEAIRLVRQSSTEWKVHPEQIGYLGFSAGGCIALSAVITNEDEGSMPDFIATAYGPSLIDVVVPDNPPPLFIAVNADHMNVAAGCLSLFTTWKRAGAHAEIHIYDVGQGPFGMSLTGNPSDAWTSSFHNWLNANGFLDTN